MPPETMQTDAVRISYLTIFTRDVAALPDFYIAVFGLGEVETSRSDRYRELAIGELKLGFPTVDAYRVLDMTDQADPTGVRSMPTFAVDSAEAVTRLTERAVEHGARLIKGSLRTAFGQVLSILLDPEGNAFRISAPLAG
jgi:predicted enzyme related to lactoylglutathione lyase